MFRLIMENFPFLIVDVIGFIILFLNMCVWKWLPGAGKLAAKAEPAAKKATEEGLKPAADAVAKNAEPMAKRVTEEGVKPAARKVAGKLEPAAEEFTEVLLRLLWFLYS